MKWTHKKVKGGGRARPEALTTLHTVTKDRVPTVMENPGKINFPEKVMKNLQKVKSRGKKFRSQKILPKDFLQITPLF